MSLGFFSGFSGVVEWTIPDFFLLDGDEGYYVESPHFALEGGSRCNFRVYPKGAYMAVGLHKDDSDDTVDKVETFLIGVKAEDRTIETAIATFGEGKSSCGWCNFLNLDDLKMHKTEMVPSGSLTFTCQMLHEGTTQDEAASKLNNVDPRRMKLVELEALSSDFKDLLIKETKYDVTANVQGKEYHAHRTVLATRSPVFHDMYTHDTTEAKTGVVIIPDCDPNSFGEFLSFLYTGKLEFHSSETAFHLYATADKYNVQRLKSFCSDYMKQNLTVETVCDIISMAEKYGDQSFMSSVQNFFNKNSLQIFLTAEWKNMVKYNPDLAYKLTEGLASAALKSA